MKKTIQNKRFGFIVGLLLPGLISAASALVDPTQPPVTIYSPSLMGGPKSLQTLQVTAIYIYPTHRLAIVNGVPVKTGDHIGEFTITAINPYTVELTGPMDRKEVLKLVVNVKQERTH